MIGAGGAELKPAVENATEDFLFIGELARETGVDPETIRFYERAELLSPPRHGRFRTYFKSDVKRLKNVLAMRRMGLPIAQIKDILAAAASENQVMRSAKAESLLRVHLHNLQMRQEDVVRQIRETAEILNGPVA